MRFLAFSCPMKLLPAIDSRKWRVCSGSSSITEGSEANASTVAWRKLQPRSIAEKTAIGPKKTTYYIFDPKGYILKLGRPGFILETTHSLHPFQACTFLSATSFDSFEGELTGLLLVRDHGGG